MIQKLDKYGSTSVDNANVVILDKNGNVKKIAAASGTVTSILTASPITGGPITSSGTIGITQATTSTDGYLSSTDWNTFNSKFNLPSLTSGSVLFSNGTTIAQKNSNFFWDDTNNRLGIGTNAPAQKIDVLANVNGGNLINIKNASTGVSGVSGFQCENNISNGSLFLTSSTYTPNGVLGNNTLGFFSNANMPIAICSGNHILMSTGGVTERMRIVSGTGNVLINTTTDNGGKLQIKAPGALSTDIALRVRNSADTADFMSIDGTGVTTLGGRLILNGNNLYFGGNNGNTVLRPSGTNLQLYNNNTGAALNLNGNGSVQIGPSNAIDWAKFSATGHTIYATTNTNFFSNGNVAIGTATDQGGKLQIKAPGALSTDIALRVRNSADTGDLATIGGTGILNLTGNILIAKATPIISINNTSSTLMGIEYLNSGTVFAYNGIASSAGAGINGSIAGDFYFRANSRKIIFSTDSGTTTQLALATTGNLLINTTTDIASSKLTVESTTQGFLPPRMTTIQKNAIATPATGLIVYDTTLLSLCQYNGTTWTNYGIGSVTSVAALTLGTTGTDLSSSVANGTTTPVITLNVPDASATNRGALTSTDWSVFNGKQNALSGTGFVKISGTTISYDNSTYYLASNPDGYITSSALSPYLLSSTAALTYYAIPTGTTSQYIRGDGSLDTFPTIPTVTPAALTKTDDTNVTLTLGGTPSTALLQATSLTLGWTGTLADSRITSATNWNTAYTNRITSLTTTGTSGAATLVGNTLNIPQYGGGGGGSTPVKLTSQTLTAASWTLVGGYYTYSFSNVNVTTSCDVSVTPQNASYLTAYNAQVLPFVGVAAGVATLYSQFPPAADMVVDIVITQTV